LSKSLTKYYQESGRAGRDGLPARCYLLANFANRYKLLLVQILDTVSRHGVSAQTNGLVKKIQEQMRSLILYCESLRCRRLQLLAAVDDNFVETDSKLCGNCDVCLKSFSCINITTQLRDLIQLITFVTCDRKKNYTLNELIRLWSGSKSLNPDLASLCGTHTLIGSGPICKLATRIGQYGIVHGYLEENFKKQILGKGSYFVISVNKAKSINTTDTPILMPFVEKVVACIETSEVWHYDYKIKLDYQIESESDNNFDIIMDNSECEVTSKKHKKRKSSIEYWSIPSKRARSRQ
jgi:superfamily II DNA helicase RecQ